MTIHASIRRAVVQLYERFHVQWGAEVHLPAVDTGHEAGPDEQLSAHLDTLRGVQAQEKEIRPYLPLLFALYIEAANPPSPSVLLTPLQQAGWQQWPAAEVAAVRDLLTLCWRRALRQAPEEGKVVGDWLFALALLEDDLRPYLELWRRRRSVIAHQHLAEFIEDHANALFKHGRLDGARWEERPLQMRQIVVFLLDHRTNDTLEHAFFRHSSKRLAKQFARAVHNLMWIRKELMSAKN